MRRSLVVLLLATTLVTGCAAPGGSAVGGTLTVFAAASLTESFTALASDFTKTHPEGTVRPTFPSSSPLAARDHLDPLIVTGFVPVLMHVMM